MTADRNRRGDATARTGSRRTTLVFVAITIVMAALTLAAPYLVHPARVAPAGAAARPRATGTGRTS